MQEVAHFRYKRSEVLKSSPTRSEITVQLTEIRRRMERNMRENINCKLYCTVIVIILAVRVIYIFRYYRNEIESYVMTTFIYI